MSPILRTFPAVLAVIGLAACDQTVGADVDRALDPLNVIDETNLSNVMLTAASPDEAVAYFPAHAERTARPHRPETWPCEEPRARGPRHRGSATLGRCHRRSGRDP